MPGKPTRKTATATTRVSSNVDNFQVFRKKVAPLIRNVGRPARGPDDSITHGIATRTYSDGTVHTVAFEELPQTEANEEPLTCIVEFKGPKHWFPKVVSGPKKRPALDPPQEDLEGEQEAEAEDRPRKRTKKSNASAEELKEKEKTARANRAAKRAKMAEERRSPGPSDKQQDEHPETAGPAAETEERPAPRQTRLQKRNAVHVQESESGVDGLAHELSFFDLQSFMTGSTQVRVEPRKPTPGPSRARA